MRKLSPTNLGMLLNARQAACEFGFITPAEFAEATLGTLDTYERLEKQRGHIYNWYDIETLQAIPPKIVSAVDSGNLAASFYCAARWSTGDAEAADCALQERRSRGSGEEVRVAMDWVEEERQRSTRSSSSFVSEYAPWLSPRFERSVRVADAVVPSTRRRGSRRRWSRRCCGGSERWSSCRTSGDWRAGCGACAASASWRRGA